MDSAEIRATLHTFFNSIMPAWPDVVPERDADCNPNKMPFMTYRVALKDNMHPSMGQAYLWTRNEGYEQLAEYETKMFEAIPVDGVVLFMPKGGSIWLYRDDATPFIQPYPQEDPNEKASLVSFIIKIGDV